MENEKTKHNMQDATFLAHMQSLKRYYDVAGMAYQPFCPVLFLPELTAYSGC